MRRYYEVLIASQQYHGKEALTYHSEQHLPVGAVVTVTLRKQVVLGLIKQAVPSPAFKTKTIDRYLQITPLPDKTIALIEWLSSYYAAPLGMVVQHFLPKSLSDKQIGVVSSISTKHTSSFALPSLTAEQKNVLMRIEQPATYLLHGETGSGKTRVYEELARHTLAKQRSVIVLTPEISLTSQLSNSFERLFGANVIRVHSQLTPGERRTVWLQILSATAPLVVIGPRSALFSPLNNIGLIVVDEAHENAYKQEQTPYYHAIRVASQLAHLHNATLVIGSATPPLVEYYMAERKGYPILRMTQLATQSKHPPIKMTVVDLKDKEQFSRSSHLSSSLLAAIEQSLNNREQSLLFLNRRGTARVVLCKTCGWQALCPRCDVTLIYHGDTHLMRCHICNYQQSAVSSCPVCHSSDIVFKSFGTKAIVDEVTRLFPKARVQRFDSDNKKAERFEQHYEHVLLGEVDILVGTQSLAKGLDLPKLSVIGVIAADTNLYTPDYTANERMYQLISQVIGRVGRGHRQGTAIIQTYQPNNPVLQAALNKDWESFYTQEMAEREQFLFPPFCHLLKLSCRRSSISRAQQAAQSLATQIADKRYKVSISGPAPSFHEKVSGRYEWQLIIKAKQRAELLKIIQELPSGWTYDIDPVSLL